MYSISNFNNMEMHNKIKALYKVFEIISIYLYF
jgi:hypothetical protein